MRRTYSLCSSPIDHKWQIGIKKVPGGLFSSWANDHLQKGDIIEVMPPMGKFFTPLGESNHKKYLAFAAGSGITPILSIIKTTLAEEQTSTFTLVFGNQSRSSIMFKDELEALKNRYMGRLSVHHIFSREKADAPINFGRIDILKCQELFETLVQPLDFDTCFLCGPAEMSLAVKNELQVYGVAENKIHLELFTTGKKLDAYKIQLKHLPDETPKSRVSVKLDGVTTQFELAYNSEPILDAALHEGMELPYGCKGGMCCTCKAKLVSGEVEMEVHYGLEPDEIAAGYILTCQSHPTTSEVVVDFDNR